MGFLTKIFSSTIKVVLTPIAIIKDVVNIVTDEAPDATKNLLESAKEDVVEAGDDLADGEFF